ncbi:MAG: ROK family protein [Pseudomonadota bacterium]
MEPNKRRMTRIGIDLGGTKISGIALAEDGQVLEHTRVPAPQGSYQETLEAIAQLVSMLEHDIGEKHGATPVGVGTPGAEIPGTGKLQNANSVWLNGKPIVSDLATALNRPVRIANDADCLALSEAVDGAAKGCETVFAAILGTGVGGAIVHNGRLLSGPNGIAGEWGHCPLPSPKPDELSPPVCWCGRIGCLETWLSGPGMAADHQRFTGNSETAEDIAKADTPARKVSLDRHLDRLARGLAMICNIIDPHVIVLGGGLSNMDHLYTGLPSAMAAHLFTTAPQVTIVKAMHGDDSGVRGAARLWDN